MTIDHDHAKESAWTLPLAPASSSLTQCLQLIDKVAKRRQPLITADAKLVAYGRGGHVAVLDASTADEPAR